MNYELARKLKEAGFAYDKDLDIRGEQASPSGKGSWLYGSKGVPSDEMVYVPTLSELIEACGDRFHSLHQMNDGSKIWWNAHGIENQFGKTSRSGDTPDVAVANLWLALNEKTIT